MDAGYVISNIAYGNVLLFSGKRVFANINYLYLNELARCH